MMLQHAPVRCPNRGAFRSHTRARVRSVRVCATAQEIKMPRWEYIYRNLKDKGLESIDVQMASALVDSGDWVLVDVRPGNLHAGAHPQGAYSAPLYQPIDFKNATPMSYLRAAIFAINGVQPTEFNPKFVEQIKEITSSGKGVIVYCEAGGTIVPTMTFPSGKPSRSLQAAYRILEEGVTDRVKHLTGGIYAWYSADLPMEGTYDTSNLGRTPNSAADAKFPTK